MVNFPAKNLFRVPIVFAAHEILAAFKNQDALSGFRERIGQRAAAGAGANDNQVVRFRCHESP